MTPSPGTGGPERDAASAGSAGGSGTGSSGGDGEPWTVLRLIRWSTGWLEEKGVDAPRPDVERLLGDALGLSRLDLYLEFERPLVPEELAAFKERLLRRGRREPLQYILGRTDFRELDLAVDRRALIPRPETEFLVGRVLEWAGAVEDRADDAPEASRPPELDALDVGTGTGAIALSLAVEGPFRRIVATDVDAGALELARENLERCAPGAPVDFRRGSQYASLAPDERFHVVVSNPPYVAAGERDELAPEIREWEPEGALFAGPSGLDVLRPLVEGAPERLHPGGLLALEVGAGQAEDVAARIRATGAFDEPAIHEDLAGRERVVLAEREG